MVRSGGPNRKGTPASTQEWHAPGIRWTGARGGNTTSVLRSTFFSLYCRNFYLQYRTFRFCLECATQSSCHIDKIMAPNNARREGTTAYNRLVTVAVAFGSLASFPSLSPISFEYAIKLTNALLKHHPNPYRHMDTPRLSLAAPSANQVGTSFSTSRNKVSLAMVAPQRMQLRQPMAYTAPAAPLAVYSSCGLPPLLVANAVSRSGLYFQ